VTCDFGLSEDGDEDEDRPEKARLFSGCGSMAVVIEIAGTATEFSLVLD
jgi:hypothetical protein